MMGWLGWKSLVNVSGLQFVSVGFDLLWIDWSKTLGRLGLLVATGVTRSLLSTSGLGNRTTTLSHT